MAVLGEHRDHPIVVECDDGAGAGMTNYGKFNIDAVGKAGILDTDVHDAKLQYGAALDTIHRSSMMRRRRLHKDGPHSPPR
jgi:hypothetical protein